MQDKIVDLSKRPRLRQVPPVTDFWFARVDERLSQIERMVRRLEWQVWLIVCTAAALLALEILRSLNAA